jgi:hypothetical protein
VDLSCGDAVLAVDLVCGDAVLVVDLARGADFTPALKLGCRTKPTPTRDLGHRAAFPPAARPHYLAQPDSSSGEARRHEAGILAALANAARTVRCMGCPAVGPSTLTGARHNARLLSENDSVIRMVVAQVNSTHQFKIMLSRELTKFGMINC